MIRWCCRLDPIGDKGSPMGTGTAQRSEGTCSSALTKDAEPCRRTKSRRTFHRTISGRLALIKDHGDGDSFTGVDVGISNHHAVAIGRAGKKRLDRLLPQDEAKLGAIIRAVTASEPCCWSLTSHRPLVPCRSPWPRARARARASWSATVRGAMRRIADLHPGEAKMPGTLRLLPKPPAPSAHAAFHRSRWRAGRRAVEAVRF